MVSLNRWLKAQEYERSYWERTANRIVSGVNSQLDWYGWRAKELEKVISGYFPEERKKNAKILEIGSGPVGIISFVKWGNRYAIEPLEDFYRSNHRLSQLRDSGVSYSKGIGEQLSFRDGFFSLIILDNVLDHVNTPERILYEINRVLEKEGILYITLNIHTLWGAFIHSILSKLCIDRGHPHTFTLLKIRKFLQSNYFCILSELVEDYQQVRTRDLKSSSLKQKIKGFSGLSEFIYMAVCSK